MKQISLTQGKFAIVDDEDFDFLSQFRWHYAEGYASKAPHIRMHRLLMNTPEGYLTDHINNNTLDNRRSNLRVVSPSQNSMNTLKRNSIYSPYKGVDYHKGEWRSRIKGKLIGGFTTEHAAALAYDLWATALFGEYAHLNFKH